MKPASLEFIIIVWVHLKWGISNARGVGGGSKHIFEKKSVLAVKEKSVTPQCGKTEARRALATAGSYVRR